MQRLAAVLLASVLLCLSAMAACAGAPTAADPAETRVELDEEGRIAYLGPLTAEANARAREIFEATEGGPGTILISSGGGSTRARTSHPECWRPAGARSASSAGSAWTT